LSGTCTATKRDGTPCTLLSSGSSDLCWAHDPANAERRRRGQSRGGRNKPIRELVAINQRLSDLADQVLSGEVDRADAAVAGQLLNYVLRGISVSLKAKEQEELEQRLEELEAALERQGKGQSSYGA
jgi:LPS O-antigen subunit length determinant protein (WzzB/FepE family)